MGLEAFGVQNLRCLTDTKLVPIRPITVLVGRNSSGKSTFLRAFPLLRQSVETARESPVLWYHPERVDFGSIQQAMNDRSDDRHVTFHFRATLGQEGEVTIGDPAVDLSLRLEGNGNALVRAAEIAVAGHLVQIQFDHAGRLSSLLVNGDDVMPPGPSIHLVGRAFLIPCFDTSPGQVAYQPLIHPVWVRSESRARHHILGLLESELLSEVFPGRGLGLNQGLDQGLLIGTHAEMIGQIQRLFSDGRFPDDFVARLDGRTARSVDIVHRVVAAMIPNLLQDIDGVIASFMARVAYLGPQRAITERLYRLQDLAVDEVDPRGKNLAMFLHSLSDPERESLASFAREHLGFDVKTQNQGLQAEILINEAAGAPFRNIADVGFGYAEVLPVAAALWSSCIREPRTRWRATSLLALEQPELHLHPAHQARLASMIAGAMLQSRKAGREVKMMVETHSEALVGGLGELIADGILEPSDVQIALFDQDTESRQTTVRFSRFTEEGALVDWPFGFFAPVRDDFLVPRRPQTG